MTDLIAKKRDGQALSTKEIYFMVRGYTRGDIPDYQMSAMLMAMYFQGLNHEETVAMTGAMVQSGDEVDLSSIDGLKADKHSTGGVGDKTSLVLCPMMAAAGVKMAKMSGRGLGHTGGTIDKLESIPGFCTSLSPEAFMEQVRTVGFAIAGQTADICPADKKLYALRDVTGTVAVRGLIVSSIMSKKLAAGADLIVLDVKTGSGSFMKTDEDARALAEEMVQVGRSAARKTVAVITSMDEPLGDCIGNALEVQEAVDTLRGHKSGNLLELCLTLGSAILCEGGVCNSDTQARAKLQATIDDGSAFAKFVEFVQAQGGDTRAVYDTSRLPEAPIRYEVISPKSGYIQSIQTEGVGRACLELGGGRLTKESVIDPAVGIQLHLRIGDHVDIGQSLATIHASSLDSAARASDMMVEAYQLGEEPVTRPAFIRGIVT